MSMAASAMKVGSTTGTTTGANVGTTAGTTAGAVGIGDVVDFLRRPAAYPGCPPVELRETHLSWVFLTPTEAYKLKKPVVNEFVDLRSLAGRLANCRAEVQLNRRLAGDVYRGLAQVTQSANGELAIDGDGRVIDWLVRMRRLPAEHMLDWLLEHERLQPEDVAAVARRLGDFFAAQPAIALGAGRHRMLLRQQLDLSRAMLARPEFGLPLQQIGAVHSAMERYLDDGADLAARVRMGRIVEGHGDLRPEHICLGAPPVIIDCLEFSRDLRLLDPFDEFAFLGLECARLGAPWVAPLLLQALAARLDDHPPMRLWHFYTALRACVRARLAVAHLLEPAPSRPQLWTPRALDYLARAGVACAALA